MEKLKGKYGPDSHVYGFGTRIFNKVDDGEGRMNNELHTSLKLTREFFRKRRNQSFVQWTLLPTELHFIVLLS